MTATGKYEVKTINNRRVTYWEFTCYNGCQKMLVASMVKSGNSSCGCIHRVRPEVRLYGFLRPTGVVQSRVCTGNRTRIFWECECTKCRSVEFRAADPVKSGKVKSCVCVKKDKGRVLAHRGPPTDYRGCAIKSLLASYKHNAVKRGFVWEITKPEFIWITSSNCHYCGVAPLQNQTYRTKKTLVVGAYVYNGVDRQDNALGYILSNCVPCCGRCNQTKMGSSVEEFLAHTANIYNHSIKKGKHDHSQT